MPYYLAPYVGSGTDSDPFRPRRSGDVEQVGWSAIDLRPDSSVASGPSNVCLLWLPSGAFVDGALKKVADTPDQIVPQADCDQINAFLGTTVTSGPFSDVVAQIMLNPPPNKWNKLQPTRGRNVIFLNGKIHDSPAVIGGGSEGYDNFQRPDADDLSMLWDPFLVGGNPATGRLRSKHVQTNASFLQAETRFQGFTPGADCYAQTRIASWAGTAGSDSTVGAGVRATTNTLRDYYGFVAQRDPTSGLDGWQLFKRVANAFTDLGSQSSPANPFIAGDWVQIEAAGSSIQGLRTRGGLGDGNHFRLVLQGPVTDTSFTLAGRGVIRVGNLNSMTDTEADAFSCGDGVCPHRFLLTAGSGTKPLSTTIVDDFNRTESPLADPDPISGAARWSLPSTQPVFPDDDVNPSVDFALDGTNILKHIQFGIGKGAYRLDYQYGQFAELGYEIVDVPTFASGQFSAILRMSNPGTNSISGYFFDMPRVRDHGSTNDEWRIWRIDPGSPYTRTQLGSSVFGPNIAIGDFICAQAYKNTLRIWHRPITTLRWGPILTVTDSTYSGLGYAGFYLNGTGQEPASQARIDNLFINYRGALILTN